MAKKATRYVDPEAQLDSNNLPIESFAQVDPKYLPNFKANNSYSEAHPSQGDTGSASYVGDQYQPNSLDDTNVYENDIPDLENERANNQGTLGALGDATAKFVGKTVLSTIGNIAGTVYGVADAIGNGQFSKIWDNSFINAVDAGNKKLDDIFHVYKNNDYQDDNILQKLYKHPTQFLDEATDTASFMAGAVLSEIATSGLSAEMVIPKALKYMKYLSEGAEATEATSKLTSFATKAITAGGELGTSIKHLAMGASYEGIVEAKQATMELQEKMENDYLKDHPGEDIPENVKSDIEDRVSKAGVFTYLANLALVGGTNLVLFPKLFGLGHDTAKVASGAIERNVIKDAETGEEKVLFESAAQRRIREGKSAHSAGSNIVTGLTKPVEESTKFGVQGTISKTAKEFFDRKNDPDAKKNVGDFLTTFAEQLGETYTSKEGWNNIGMGMIIGALGAPGRGILAPLGESNALGKYGYKDVLDENGNKVGSEKLPTWTGGVAGSFHQRAAEEAKIGKIVSDLNEHTNFFKAAKANYDTLVENNSLQKDQDEALSKNDIFNFQNAKDDQIHSYVSSRIKNNLYEDLLDEVDKMKKLSPDEFYTNFKGDEASNQATNIEKLKFQLDTTSQFLAKAKNTRDAIKIADNVYRGDNDDLREHLVHSIAASKNLDLREKLINQSIADLTDGLVSNLNLRTSNASVDQIMDHLKEANPTAYALNKDKVRQLLEDSEKLRTKRQDYLDVYNHLFTQEGQKQFNDYQEAVKKKAQDEKIAEDKKVADKQTEDIKKENIKATVEKAKEVKKDIKVDEHSIHDLPDSIKNGDNLEKGIPKVTNVDDFDDEDNIPTEGTKEAPQATNNPQTITNTPEENKGSTEANNKSLAKESLQKVDDFNIDRGTKLYDDNGEYVGTIQDFNVHSDGEHLESIKLEDGRTLTDNEWYNLNVSNEIDKDVPSEDHLDPEETAIVAIEDSKELTTQRELANRDTGLVRNDSVENYQKTSSEIKLVNLDLQRTIGNTIAYLGIDKITLGKFNREENTVETRTLDIFDNDGNIEVNKFVEPKLFSQNHYTINTPVELFVPTFEEMEERGLQQYSNTEYQTSIDNLDEYPIAIRGTDGKIIGFINTQSGIKRLVAEEFRDQALKENAALRNFINENRDRVYKTTITSKSPGMLIADRFSSQKNLFKALGNGTNKLADKVKLGIVKVEKDIDGNTREPGVRDIKLDLTDIPFRDGDIINPKSLSNGVVYAILPTAAKESYVVYPMKTNKIGINSARTIVEAIRIFAKKENLTTEEKQSKENIGDFNIDNFKDLTNFVNRIMYASSDLQSAGNNVFKLFKNKLVLSALDDQIFPLEDIINSQEVRNKIVDVLADRYYSVGLKNLNSAESYMSYHLNEDTGSIEEKHNETYQHYINDNNVLTTNVRGVHIENNEYAFTAQPVIGLANTISKDTKQIASNQEAAKTDGIEDAQVIEDTPEQPVRDKKIETSPEPEEKPARKTRKTTIDPNRIKKGPLNDINLEHLQKANVKDADDLRRKCL